MRDKTIKKGVNYAAIFSQYCYYYIVNVESCIVNSSISKNKNDDYLKNQQLKMHFVR